MTHQNYYTCDHVYYRERIPVKTIQRKRIMGWRLDGCKPNLPSSSEHITWEAHSAGFAGLLSRLHYEVLIDLLTDCCCGWILSLYIQTESLHPLVTLLAFLEQSSPHPKTEVWPAPSSVLLWYKLSGVCACVEGDGGALWIKKTNQRHSSQELRAKAGPLKGVAKFFTTPGVKNRIRRSQEPQLCPPASLSNSQPIFPLLALFKGSRLF